MAHLVKTVEANDDARFGEPRCTRRLWGDPVGLLCSRTDHHTPGPSECRYLGSAVEDGLPLRV